MSDERYPLLYENWAKRFHASLVQPFEPPKRELRCGPWDESKDGLVCRQCGRLDPLNLGVDFDDE